MTNLFLLLTSGLILIKEVRGVSYLLIVKDAALVLGFVMLFLIVVGFFIGLLGGWFLARDRRLLSLKIRKKDRVLVITPHPDDETLALGGLLSDLAKREIPKKIVFITNGDNNPYSFVQDKTIRFYPAKFIEIGEKRAKEAETAAKYLGVSKKELTFLGYPDARLLRMFKKPKELVAGKSTKITSNPYRFSPNLGKEYRGASLSNDLKKIILKFKPTVIFVSHQRDGNRDHRAVNYLVRRVLRLAAWKGEVFQYLVHFKLRGIWRIYPRKGKRNQKDWAIYPPLALWQKDSWYSFWLTESGLKRKKKALSAYRSQKAVPTLKNLFASFLAQNEIFERITH